MAFAALGDVLQDLGDLVGGGVERGEKLLCGFAVGLDFVAVCAQRGNVANQGIVDFQQHKAVVEFVAVFVGFAGHIRQHAG